MNEFKAFISPKISDYLVDSFNMQNMHKSNTKSQDNLNQLTNCYCNINNNDLLDEYRKSLAYITQINKENESLQEKLIDAMNTINIKINNEATLMLEIERLKQELKNAEIKLNIKDKEIIELKGIMQKQQVHISIGLERMHKKYELKLDEVDKMQQYNEQLKQQVFDINQQFKLALKKNKELEVENLRLANLKRDNIIPAIEKYLNYIITLVETFNEDHFAKNCFKERFIRNSYNIKSAMEAKSSESLALKAYQYITDLLLNLNSTLKIPTKSPTQHEQLVMTPKNRKPIDGIGNLCFSNEFTNDQTKIISGRNEISNIKALNKNLELPLSPKFEKALISDEQIQRVLEQNGRLLNEKAEVLNKTQDKKYYDQKELEDCYLDKHKTNILEKHKSMPHVLNIQEIMAIEHQKANLYRIKNPNGIDNYHSDNREYSGVKVFSTTIQKNEKPLIINDPNIKINSPSATKSADMSSYFSNFTKVHPMYDSDLHQGKIKQKSMSISTYGDKNFTGIPNYSIKGSNSTVPNSPNSQKQIILERQKIQEFDEIGISNTLMSIKKKNLANFKKINEEIDDHLNHQNKIPISTNQDKQAQVMELQLDELIPKIEKNHILGNIPKLDTKITINSEPYSKSARDSNQVNNNIGKIEKTHHIDQKALMKDQATNFPDRLKGQENEKLSDISDKRDSRSMMDSFLVSLTAENNNDKANDSSDQSLLFTTGQMTNPDDKGGSNLRIHQAT